MKSEGALNNLFFDLPLIGWLISRFGNYRNLQPRPFLWRITLEGFLVVIPISFIFTLLIDPSPRADIEELYSHGTPYILLEVAIFTPFF